MTNHNIRIAAGAVISLTCALVAQDQPTSRPMASTPEYCSLDKIVGATVRMHAGAEAKREARKDGDVATKPEGSIDDLIIDRDGKLQYAVVKFGGFIGIGDKTVAVPMSSLTWVPAHERFEIAASEDRLRALPEFDLASARRTGLDQTHDRLETQWRTTGTAEASGTAGVPRDATDTKLERDAKEAGREVKEAGREAGREIKEAGREVKEEAKEAGREIREGTKEAGREVKEETREAGREVREGAREAAADVKGEMRTLEGTKFHLVPARFMTANEIDDHAVYTRNEKFGSISDVIVDRNKREIALVVVKRGGALGIGGTEYLVPFSALNHCTSGDERVHCLDADVARVDTAVVYEKPKEGIVEAEAARRALASTTFGRAKRLDGAMRDKNELPRPDRKDDGR